MTHNISYQSLDGNDPLQAAYQRLKEARDAVDAASVHTMPLSQLSALTEELKNAKDIFLEQLEYDQRENTIEIRGHTLYRREYEALEQLARLNNQKIDDLVDGILQVENGRVSSLDLTSKRLTDISPLAGLTQLRELWISKNEISDISPLAGLTQLRDLVLSDNNIQDISPLAGLTQLKKLWLENNDIQDISSLAGLTQLELLRLKENEISDLSPLAGLTRLTRLHLDYNNIQDLSPLAGLTRLTRLHLDYNNIQDISALAGLTQLRELRLECNNIQDISPLADLTQLRELYLINNQVDISLLNGIMGIFRGIFPKQLKNRWAVQQLQNHGCKITGVEQ